MGQYAFFFINVLVDVYYIVGILKIRENNGYFNNVLNETNGVFLIKDFEKDVFGAKHKYFNI